MSNLDQGDLLEQGLVKRSNGGASRKPAKYQFARNVGGQLTTAEREYRAYATSPPEKSERDPDVLVDVPAVKVDKIHLSWRISKRTSL